ncbi:MAG: tRNA (cytosine(32)/uridine(32)-2'-O)-methyltransferase TrmJ, partial [Tolumonas sp.]
RQTQFLHSDHPGHVMMRLRRMFTRLRPDNNELNILRGILTSVQKTLRNS